MREGRRRTIETQKMMGRVAQRANLVGFLSRAYSSRRTETPENEKTGNIFVSVCWEKLWEGINTCMRQDRHHTLRKWGRSGRVFVRFSLVAFQDLWADHLMFSDRVSTIEGKKAVSLGGAEE